MKILTLLTLITLTGCATDRYRVIHKEFTLKPVCIFEKFTDAEKDTMTEAVGRKIYRNQENCRIRERENQANVKAHNDAHRDKQ